MRNAYKSPAVILVALIALTLISACGDADEKRMKFFDKGMTLYEQGEFQLDDPVRKFIPEFSTGPRDKITVLQLLTHVSGLPDQLLNQSVSGAEANDRGQN